MPVLKQGQKAPDFTLPTDSENILTLSKLSGKNVVLYFYPKDDTPGCTKEACGFNEQLAAFKSLGTHVIGVSKCSPSKHDKFKAKYGLGFTLASDEDGTVCEAYGTWMEKSMYGKKYMGIDRATFLIDANGKIAQIWRSVKIPGHVDEVKAALQNLNKNAT